MQLAWLTLPAALMSAAQAAISTTSSKKPSRTRPKRSALGVVQIQTQGGTDMVVTSPKGPMFRKAFGPTTGVVVDESGYIISSAFNFINNPTTILVAIPGTKEPMLAKKVATDKSRMLTLLKVEMNGLPVPMFVPAKDLKVGQSALAMGRTLDSKLLDTKRDHPPSISIGIISALGRIWGKAMQTDAKVSPVNYGGPLIDIQGRVQGILIPASQRKDGETAGFEWYDSGIGFAVPMEDVMAMLPRLKKGKDLDKAVLGVQMKGQDQFSARLPEVDEVQAESGSSAADKARPARRATSLPKSTASPSSTRPNCCTSTWDPSMKATRSRSNCTSGGKEEVAVGRRSKLISIAKDERHYHHPNSYLGILPMRDDPQARRRSPFRLSPKAPPQLPASRLGDRIVQVWLADGEGLERLQGRAKR